VVSSWTLITRGVRATEKAGQNLGELFIPGDIIGLVGELGSGKTSLTRGIARGLGVKELVTSPSFIILNIYHGRLPFYHFDLYRLSSSEELDQLGYEEFFFDKGVTVIEWAEKIFLRLFQFLEIRLSFLKEKERKLEFFPRGMHYEEIMISLTRKCPGIIKGINSNASNGC